MLVAKENQTHTAYPVRDGMISIKSNHKQKTRQTHLPTKTQASYLISSVSGAM